MDLKILVNSSTLW